MSPNGAMTHPRDEPCSSQPRRLDHMPGQIRHAWSRELTLMLRLATPVVVAEVGWLAMQIVDIAMVGRLGVEAIGAVGVGSALYLAVAVCGMGLLLGLDTLVSQASGGRQPNECRLWLRHGLLLAVLLAIPLTVAGRVAANNLDLWGLDPAVLGLTRGYFRVVTWSTVPLLLYFALRRYLQAVDVVTPVMLTLITANLINAAANWLLVFGHLGFPALGVEGAGWATCISRVYMFAVLAVVTRHKVDQDRTSIAVTGFEPARLRRLLQLGWPAAIQLTLEVGVVAAASALAGRLEPQFLAAHHIVLNLVGLTFMVPLGVSAAGAVRVGQAVGRNNPTGARRAGWVALGIGAVFMSAAALIFVAIPERILGTFTADTDVIATGVTLLLVAAIFQLFDGLQGVATGVLRGLGDTRTPMLSNLAGHWFVGLPVGYTLCFQWGFGVVGLWVGLSIGLILVGLILVPVWHRRITALRV